MRRLIAICVGLLAATAAATAAPPKQPDGTLSVRNAKGSVTFAVRGAIIGRFDSGKIVVDDPDPTDGAAPVVTGAEKVTSLTDKKASYSGQKVRFRLVGGYYRIRVSGVAINLSAVGRGTVTLDGSDYATSDGVFSMNGDEFRSLPPVPTVYSLSGSSTG